LGSFGHLSEVRSDLVEDSLRKIKKINPDVERKDVYIIGDAPGDVKCGKAAKVKTIAVAAGKFSADELSKYHPTYLFNDFSDTEVIIKTIEE
jgi:phosphoglycolate phosphatase-like HAD superfamily hydrolase